jgi:hypothetical protein
MSNDFKTFTNWLFDGNLLSEIPPELTKSSSPISNYYCINIFMKCGKLNHYLNKYLNNYGVFYIPKDELFKFIKRCVKDYKISRNQIWYYSKKQKQEKIVEVLSEKYPLLKNYEIYHLSDLIKKSTDKNKILEGLGLKSDNKKTKVKKKNKNKKNDDKTNRDMDYNINTFLNKNFVYIELENFNL